jgi:hypothetical protein
MQSEMRVHEFTRIVCVTLMVVIVAAGNCFATDLISSFKSFDHQGPVYWHFAAGFGTFYDTTDKDFAVPGRYSIRLYKNAGYGAFSLADSIDWGTEVLTTTDLNNDGYTDIVAKGTDGAYAGAAARGDGYEVFINTPSAPGTFTARLCPIDTSGEGGYGAYATYFGKCADLNGDGYPDCAHWIFDGTYVGLMDFDPDNDSLVPNPNGNGVQFIRITCTLGCQDGELVDLDGDGDLDIVTANGVFYSSAPPADSLWVTVFTNDGTGSFSADTLDPEPGISDDTWALRISSGLMNADSYPDVIVARQEQSAADSLIFYDGSSNGILTYDTAIALESISWLTTADVDGDDNLDLVAGAFDSIVVFYNDGSRNFTKEIVKPDGADFGFVWNVGHSDVDSDGDLDLLVSDKDDGKTWVCYNHAVADTAGDCNDDGVFDVFDLIALVDYVYSAGDPPTPWYAGDCNFDGTTDALDVVYLVDYLFYSGPLPFVH